MSFTDSLLKERILAAREKSLLWLNKMQLPNATAGVLRVSELHQPEQWPQMLLPGTYDGTMARVLLGDEIAGKEALADWILGHQGRTVFSSCRGCAGTKHGKDRMLKKRASTCVFIQPITVWGRWKCWINWIESSCHF